KLYTTSTVIISCCISVFRSSAFSVVAGPLAFPPFHFPTPLALSAAAAASQLARLLRPLFRWASSNSFRNAPPGAVPASQKVWQLCGQADRDKDAQARWEAASPSCAVEHGSAFA